MAKFTNVRLFLKFVN